MKIKKITIENFRGIDSLTLDLTDPSGKPLDLVVLAGPNGCGKTSVLEACVFACGKKDLLGQKVEHSKSNVRLGNQQFAIEATFFLGGGDEFSQQIVGRWEKDTTALTSASSRGLPAFPFEYFSSRRAQELVGSVPATIFSIPNVVAEANRLNQIKRYLVDFANRAMWQKEGGSLVPIAENDKNPLQKINKGWKLFYPEKEQEFSVAPAGEVVGGGFDIFFDDGSGKKLPVDALSSGEIEIFTMLGWFAIHDFSGGIILIDEPELHLHTAWHRAIMRALRTVLPTTQIICATHSLEILDSAYSYERFTLLPEDDPRIRLAKSARS